MVSETRAVIEKGSSSSFEIAVRHGLHDPYNNRMFPPWITSNTRKRMLKCSSMQTTSERTTLGEVPLSQSSVALLRGRS